MKQEKSKFWINCNIQLAKAIPGILCWHLLSLKPTCSLLCRCYTNTPLCKCKHTHTQRLSQTFVGRAEIHFESLETLPSTLCELYPSEAATEFVSVSSSRECAGFVPGKTRRKPFYSALVLLLELQPQALILTTQSHFIHMNNHSKFNEAPHISISNCFGCRKALPISPGGAWKQRSDSTGRLTLEKAVVFW